MVNIRIRIRHVYVISSKSQPPILPKFPTFFFSFPSTSEGHVRCNFCRGSSDLSRACHISEVKELCLFDSDYDLNLKGFSVVRGFLINEMKIYTTMCTRICQNLNLKNNNFDLNELMAFFHIENYLHSSTKFQIELVIRRKSES
jgi:hypothetical protein